MNNIDKLREAMRLIKEVEASCKRNTRLCLKTSEGYIGNAIKWESSRRIRKMGMATQTPPISGSCASKTANKIDVDIDVNAEKLDDMVDILKEINLPNITIRNNDNVNVTINYFNATMRDYFEEDK